MSFAVWKTKPPFSDADLNPGERIYERDGLWIVTDQGEPTDEQVVAVLNPPPGPTEAEQFVARIKADPAALTLLKAELSRV